MKSRPHDNLLDHIPATPVGLEVSEGPSKFTSYHRLASSPAGLRLVPSPFPVYLGLAMLGVYVVVGFAAHGPIAAALQTVPAHAPFSWVIIGIAGLALAIGAFGPIAMYGLARHSGTSVHVDLSAGAIRVASAGAVRTIAIDDVCALQVCRSSIGTPQRQVTAYELNLVTTDGAEGIERVCLLCGGPHALITGRAKRIAEFLGVPTVLT